jgi:hypothetical protein
MSGVLKKSLASWRDAHGFGILNVVWPEGERFFVEAGPAPAVSGIPGANKDAMNRLSESISGKNRALESA